MGPLVAAWFLYFSDGGWRPQGTTEHGILVDPPVPLPDVRIADQGPDGSDGDLRGRDEYDEAPEEYKAPAATRGQGNTSPSEPDDSFRVGTLAQANRAQRS